MLHWLGQNTESMRMPAENSGQDSAIGSSGGLQVLDAAPAVRKDHTVIGNRSFCEQLDWSEERYEQIKEFLIKKGKVVRGRGCGGSDAIAT